MSALDTRAKSDALAQGLYSVKALLDILKSGENWDWTNSGDFNGLSGRGGAVKISEQIVAEFVDEGGMSISSLAKQIVGN